MILLLVTFSFRILECWKHNTATCTDWLECVDFHNYCTVTCKPTNLLLMRCSAQHIIVWWCTGLNHCNRNWCSIFFKHHWCSKKYLLFVCPFGWMFSWVLLLSIDLFTQLFICAYNVLNKQHSMPVWVCVYISIYSTQLFTKLIHATVQSYQLSSVSTRLVLPNEVVSITAYLSKQKFNFPLQSMYMYGNFSK